MAHSTSAVRIIPARPRLHWLSASPGVPGAQLSPLIACCLTQYVVRSLCWCWMDGLGHCVQVQLLLFFGFPHLLGSRSSSSLLPSLSLCNTHVNFSTSIELAMCVECFRGWGVHQVITKDPGERCGGHLQSAPIFFLFLLSSAHLVEGSSELQNVPTVPREFAVVFRSRLTLFLALISCRSGAVFVLAG